MVKHLGSGAHEQVTQPHRRCRHDLAEGPPPLSQNCGGPASGKKFLLDPLPNGCNVANANAPHPPTVPFRRRWGPRGGGDRLQRGAQAVRDAVFRPARHAVAAARVGNRWKGPGVGDRGVEQRQQQPAGVKRARRQQQQRRPARRHRVPRPAAAS
jgi:hypothetical protein